MPHHDGETGHELPPDQDLRIGDDDDLAPRPVLSDGSGQEVRRRHVLYIPGYDPRDPGLYRRFAAFELRRFARLWGAKVDVDDKHVDDPAIPSVRWTARAVAGEAKVEVVYETLRWDDIVARDFSTPLPRKFLAGFVTLFDALFSGLLFRVARAAPWCAIAWLFPVSVILFWTLLGVGLGYGISRVAEAYGQGVLGVLAWLGLSVGTPLAALAVMRKRGSFVVHLMDDGAAQRSYARRLDPVTEARIDAFADRIRAIKAQAEVQELLIVGHSSGSFMGIDALARALEKEPELGKGNRPAIALLTVGASELLVGMHPAAGWFRERLKRVAVDNGVFWAEVVAPWDTLNFPHRSPVEELKLDVPADCPNPTFRRAFLTKMLKAESIAKLRRERNIFRAHFQFIMANEVRGPFDYFSLVCSPWRTKTQFRRTAKGAYMSPHLGAPVYPAAKEPVAA